MKGGLRPAFPFHARDLISPPLLVELLHLQGAVASAGDRDDRDSKLDLTREILHGLRE
jgi:hypothetical protein